MMSCAQSSHATATLPPSNTAEPTVTKTCNFCGQIVDRFLPYRGGAKSRSPLMVHLESVGSDIENYLCPSCKSNDRERHLKMYIEATGILEGRKNLRILHFAAESTLLNYLGRYDIEVHVRADLFPKSGTFERINIQNIPYDDDSFDLVIANHVLEHVEDLEGALAQINRVLKPDGLAILQTPYSNRLAGRLEDSGIDNADLRHLFYGQSDHVRLFGKNIFDEYSNYLTPRTYRHQDLFDEDVGLKHGVNCAEPFFLFGKKSNPGVSSVAPRLMRTSHQSTDAAPLVSVACITYNHGRYIASALESFVKQEVDFKFEIVVGEDYSTDNTLDIVMDYERAYPELIKVVRTGGNIGGRKNLICTLQQCKGKYIAFCEGDDYWTDLKKLQKQVDFLEKNPGYSMVYSGVCAHAEGKVDYQYVGGEKRDLRGVELMTTQPINTPTVMARNMVDYLPIEFLISGTGDMFMWSLLGQMGDGKYLESVLPSVYRMHAGGTHSLKSVAERRRSRVHTCFALALYYERNGLHQVVSHLVRKIKDDLTVIRKSMSFAGLDDFIEFIKYDIETKAKDELTPDLLPLEQMARAEYSR